jgi:cyclophilin family peptidyl-prolyl cis-trans isomerase
MAQLEEMYPNEVRFVFRHYPLIGTPEQPFHDKATLSAQAAEAAGIQGKFWEMHDILFERQAEWAGMSVEQFEVYLHTVAEELGLEVKQFANDLTSEDLVNQAQEAWDRGREIGIPGTPFLLVDGNPWPNNVPMDLTNMSAVVELTLLEEQQFRACPPMTIDPLKQYTATIHSEKGDIVLELFPEDAPMAVNNFIFLSRNGWYDGITFHRVFPGFMAQSGDPTGTGYGGPGYSFDNEISPNLTFDKAGLIAMANAGPGTNGSQFFITYAPQPDLDLDLDLGRHGYTIFGQVIEGQDVLDNLTPRDPSQSVEPGDMILNVTIVEK